METRSSGNSPTIFTGENTQTKGRTHTEVPVLINENSGRKLSEWKRAPPSMPNMSLDSGSEQSCSLWFEADLKREGRM